MPIINTDCNGHGTHVASTSGGKVYGVAKSTTLVAVKVLACDGSGSNSGVIGGVDYVAKMAKNLDVANLSLGGGKSTALNRAVASAVDAGVVFVVAAGNENQDACSVSPASAPEAFTVEATTFSNNKDQRSSFSNYGECVDIAAPGSLIPAAWINDQPNTPRNCATRTISGTSMASPHVAGAAALFSASRKYGTVDEVKNAMLSASTANVIDQSCGVFSWGCSYTPNKLLYVPHC